MWKVQHPEGQREINELHLPVGRPVKLTMTSQDVIHSFFVPAFRTKQDVLPGRYTTTWFEATKPGKYHLFCAEYCGTKHSGMIGYIYAMTPTDYQTWLTQGAPEGSLASQGEKYFHQYGCANCHHFDNQGRCPDLRNLYMRPVQISTGQTVTADDSYLRESILDPNAKIVYGFHANIMPNFNGQIPEEQVLALISYIKALGPQAGNAGCRRAPAPFRDNTAFSRALPDRAQPRARILNWSSADMIEAPAAIVEKNYLTEKQGILSWLLTTDHKRIGLLYTVSITALFFIGGFFALLMRLELLSPRNWLVTAETYNKLFTMHGIIMVWFFLIPSIPTTLGNFVIPLMIGAKDLAFPKLNLASWYVFMFAAAVTVYALFRGGVDTGWTFYTPFSSSYSTTYVIAAAAGIFINGFSSIMTGVNFIATIHKMRAPGLTWFRMPIFLWSMYATSVIFVLATPVLAVTCLWSRSSVYSRWEFSILRWAAIRCCFNTCSGFTRIRRYTSWCYRPSPWLARLSPPSRASRCLDTRLSPSQA